MKKTISFICFMFAMFFLYNNVQAKEPNDGECVWFEPKCAAGMCLNLSEPTIDSEEDADKCSILNFTGSPCQIWQIILLNIFSSPNRIKLQHLNYFKFLNSATKNKNLDESVCSSEITAVQGGIVSEKYNQVWKFEDSGDGYVYIKNFATGHYLTVDSTIEGFKVSGYYFKGLDCQKWKIHEK